MTSTTTWAFLTALLLHVAAPAPASSATATIDPAGFIRLDGEPYFPIGIIHTSWIGNRQGVKAVPDLHAIADAGFDLIHPTVDNRPDMANLFAAAAARGVHVIAEIPWGAATSVIDHWKAESALIGWNIADDFNAPRFGPPNHPPSELAERQALVRSLDPDRLTYASGGPFPGFTIAPYVGTIDVMGFQMYPIDEQSYDVADELQETIDEVDWVESQLAGTDQVWVANPQAFAWRRRYPTPREARNVLYASILRGARGVVWYTYWGENGVLSTKNPTLWGELRREIRELRTLTPFLLFGARTSFVTGHGRVHGSWWLHDQQIVAVVLNTHRTTAVPVALDLPAGAGAAQPLFPTRAEGGMTLTGGQFTGTIGPEEVHVYVVDMAPPGNLPPVPSVAVDVDPATLGQAVTFDASASHDPDGTVGSVAWDFGDGTTATGLVVSHAFTTLGRYAVRVTVRDGAGVPATAFAPVSVEPTGLCGAAPASGCHTAAASQLTLKTPASRARPTLLWRWTRGVLPIAELGDPSTTDVALCVWDAAGKRLATGVPAGAPGWQSFGSGGFRWSDRTGAPAGLVTGRLVASDAATGTALWKGKGAALPDPGLPLLPPVVVQLRTAGGCWESTFTNLQRNTSTELRASH